MDVVVVGAGYAGLSAALDLVEAGRSVVVCEADDRVGGRTSARNHDGVVIDEGGQWVGPTQERLHHFAERFECERFRSFDTGTHLEVWPGGSLHPYSSDEPPDAPGCVGYDDTLERLDLLAARVDLAQPWVSPDMAEQDCQTFETWLTTEVDDPAVRSRMRLAVQGVWACEPRDVSLFHVLFYVASAGGWHQLMTTIGGAQDSRFIDGASSPAAAAAAELGDAVRLNCAVSSIEWAREMATVGTSRGPITASRVIVTGTSPAQARIAFTPILSLPRRRWNARSVMGDVAKIHLVYKQPFWRSSDLSGQFVTYDDGPIAYTFDNTPHEESAGVLVGFVYGDHYRAWSAQDPGSRRDSVIAQIAAVFGDDALNPTHYLEMLWPEHPIAEGGYGAVPSPGTWAAHGRLGWRAPVGPLHWAGTETASHWNGYIDGAIESGQRAAAEVLAVLGG